MDSLISDILLKMKPKYEISTYDLERIIDSQFKVLQNNIEARKPKNTNLIYIGKFKPTKYLIRITNEQLAKEL